MSLNADVILALRGERLNSRDSTLALMFGTGKAMKAQIDGRGYNRPRIVREAIQSGENITLSGVDLRIFMAEHHDNLAKFSQFLEDHDIWTVQDYKRHWNYNNKNKKKRLLFNIPTAAYYDGIQDDLRDVVWALSEAHRDTSTTSITVTVNLR